MVKPNQSQLAAQLGVRRDPAQIDRDVAGTVFGQISEQKAPSTEVPVSRVRPSPYQRRQLNIEHVRELAESIQVDGLLEPIIVRDAGDGWFEHVAGLHRVEAYKLLGIEMIPAHIRTMTDAQAARALTINNTQHSGMTDYDLFLHAQMLREQNAVTGVTDLANVLGLSRAAIYNIEAYGALSDEAREMLSSNRSVVGSGVVYKLKRFAENSSALVTEAIRLVCAGTLNQSDMPSWVEAEIAKSSGDGSPENGGAAERAPKERRDLHFKVGDRIVKISATDDKAKLSGDLDYEKVLRLIQANIDSLWKE